MEEDEDYLLDDTYALRDLIDEDSDEDDGAILFSDDDIIPEDDDPDDEDFEEEPDNFGFSEEELDEEDIDEDFEFRNALREARNFRPKPQKGAKKTKGLAAMRRKIRREELSPEVKLLLSQANEAFVRNDLPVAQNLYLEVVKLDKNNFSAYKTLGEIYRLQGNYNKCSNFWLLAAHLHSWDYEFWRTLAELSVELEHTRQAVYCYSKAISASNGKDLDSIFSRACLYRERGQYKRASDGLLKLRALMPQEPKICRELAKIYVDENRVNDAINMYTRILEDNMKHRRGEKTELKTITFDWSELNILLELYGKKAAWTLAIKALKTVSRWIQFRESQTFWDDQTTVDSEFDDRRFENPRFQALRPEEKAKEYTLPIDIRVQLGLFRLNSKNTNEALRHFEYVLAENIQETADLFLRIGTELETFGLYHEALRYFYPVSNVYENNPAELILSIAKCLRETEDFENARDAYKRLLEHDPDNVEIKVALAEVYFYLDDIQSMSLLYQEAREQRSEERASARKNLLQDTEDVSEDEEMSDDPATKDPDQMALIAEYPSSRKAKRKKFTPLAPEVLHKKELKSTTRINEQYARANRLLERLEDDSDSLGVDRSSIASMWIDIVSELIEVFSTYRCFFSSDKAKKFNTSLRRRTEKLSIDQKLSRLPYLQDEMILSKEMDSGRIPIPSEKFKGIAFTNWFDLFMKYSLMISEYESNVEDALSVQEIARHINVFKKKELTITLGGLSVGFITNDVSVIMNHLRILMNDYQFSIPALKTFLAACKPTELFYHPYVDAPNQKYILRQIKTHDSLKEGRDISGMAAITNTNVDTTKFHPLLNYVYSTFLYVNKSYTAALTYSFKIYRDYCNDPSLVFLMALSNLHRSMQRQTINKNFQIIQGLTFMLEYAELRRSQGGYDMEINYNLGRTFNLLGLNTLALQFYEKVLELDDDEPYDLKYEAAYNSYLIYSYDGNFELAEQVMEKYLCV
ncbi:hypothetical protein OGAPHI_000775 [Ogataea philodendri]|uniref:Uncharacterized protein n=2 Tax=Ogataea TaxID=461281 RepID=A0A9P8PGK9_9ASCO|nr:uncharacterized protein OGAPHI_000775 [Ogataea philodendri]KAH3671064.1 hypothetical protein OGAPHI_000775 [Ogataea philodendri]